MSGVKGPKRMLVKGLPLVMSPAAIIQLLYTTCPELRHEPVTVEATVTPLHGISVRAECYSSSPYDVGRALRAVNLPSGDKLTSTVASEKQRVGVLMEELEADFDSPKVLIVRGIDENKPLNELLAAVNEVPHPIESLAVMFNVHDDYAKLVVRFQEAIVDKKQALQSVQDELGIAPNDARSPPPNHPPPPLPQHLSAAASTPSPAYTEPSPSTPPPADLTTNPPVKDEVLVAIKTKKKTNLLKKKLSIVAGGRYSVVELEKTEEGKTPKKSKDGKTPKKTKELRVTVKEEGGDITGSFPISCFKRPPLPHGALFKP